MTFCDSFRRFSDFFKFTIKIGINLVFLLFLISWGNAAKRGLSGKHGNRGLAHFETRPVSRRSVSDFFVKKSRL